MTQVTAEAGVTDHHFQKLPALKTANGFAFLVSLIFG
jgi:hypothetical protein